MEKKKEISEEDIKKKVKEWMLGLLHHFGAFGFDKYLYLPKLKCPKPGCDGDIVNLIKQWKCPFCGFVIPEHLVPPAFSALVNLYKEKERQRELQKTESRVDEILAKF